MFVTLLINLYLHVPEIDTRYGRHVMAFSRLAYEYKRHRVSRSELVKNVIRIGVGGYKFCHVRYS